VKTNDPRPSVAARYNTFADYHGKVRRRLERMVSDRLLLCEDAGTEEARLTQAGITRACRRRKAACSRQSSRCGHAARTSTSTGTTTTTTTTRDHDDDD